MINTTKVFSKNSAFIFLASTAMLGLSGCATLPDVQDKCTPGINPNEPWVCPSLVLQTLDSPVSASSLANSFDASKFKADMTGSTVGIPSSGLYSITLNNQYGQPIAQRAFSWSRQGTIISIDDPLAVKNWMSSVSGIVKSVSTNFVTLPVTSQPGINAYMISITYDQTTLGSAGKVWTESSCNTGSFGGTFSCLE